MIQELTLKSFKSFGEPPPESGAIQQPWAGEKIKFGGLSLLIGTNASGKSNIRDALRFIHGISRGYTLAEVIGEKYGEGGELQWKGVRGGVRETVTRNGQPENSKFTIAIRTQLLSDDGGGDAEYFITVDAGDKNRPPRVTDEWLQCSQNPERSFNYERGREHQTLSAFNFQNQPLKFDRPLLTQLSDTNHQRIPGWSWHCKKIVRRSSALSRPCGSLNLIRNRSVVPPFPAKRPWVTRGRIFPRCCRPSARSPMARRRWSLGRANSRLWT